MADEDFDEEEVWSVAHRKDGSPKGRTWRDPDPPPSASHRVLAGSIQRSNRALQHSAPVNIPYWSQIYKQKSSSRGHGDDEADAIDVDEEDGDEDEDPPHEWIMKKLARSQISSFSVCEGAGRTLKGRDLSKVRNAVLIRTGFIE